MTTAETTQNLLCPPNMKFDLGCLYPGDLWVQAQAVTVSGSSVIAFDYELTVCLWVKTLAQRERPVEYYRPAKQICTTTQQ